MNYPKITMLRAPEPSLEFHQLDHGDFFVFTDVRSMEPELMRRSVPGDSVPYYRVRDGAPGALPEVSRSPQDRPVRRAKVEIIATVEVPR